MATPAAAAPAPPPAATTAWGGAAWPGTAHTQPLEYPGDHGLSYNSNASVNNLVNAKYLSILQTDRNPPPACGDGVCNGTESHASCPGDCDVGECTGGKIDCCDDGVCRTVTLCQKLHCL